MKKSISLKVNGVERHADVEPRTTLLDLVREQFNLTGAKLGCDMQVCGACTLLLDGKPVSACSVLAVDTDGCEVLTIEGLSNKNALHPLQEAFMEFGALQCGYCTSGFILTAKALLDEIPRPTDEQIRACACKDGVTCLSGVGLFMNETDRKASASRLADTIDYAAVADRIFAEGKEAACLYTDLRNPFSNRCYARIGFKPVCVSWHIVRHLAG